MDHGVPIGLYRNYEIIMNPDPEEVIQEKDQLVLFTETLHTAKLSDEVSLSTNEISENKAVPERDTRVLVFGCNESLKTVISELPENVREVRLVNYEKDDLSEIKETASDRGILLSDITVNTEDEKELLTATRYMEHVIILGSHDEDEETADMETIFLLLSLRDIRARYHLRFNITAEMQKEMNQALVDDAEKTDFIVASNMSSLFLGQLSKRPELIGIFREILANQGNEILLKRADRIGCMGEHTVRELREMIYRQGYIMMGYLKSGEAMVSDPPLDEKVKLEREDSLIVLGEN
jgi:hypothetical protein